MTHKGGSQACAACKYSRRKCSPECPLAPYFPPHQTKIFQNAHKLFGIKKIVNILKHLDDASQKQEAMHSIIYEANIRDRFPVHGCLGIICQLHYQIREVEQELLAVLSQLEIYRQRQGYDGIHPFSHITIHNSQSYIDDPKVANYKSSSEESLKDPTQSIEHGADNELKSDAACFSLTNLNFINERTMNQSFF